MADIFEITLSIFKFMFTTPEIVIPLGISLVLSILLRWVSLKIKGTEIKNRSITRKVISDSEIDIVKKAFDNLSDETLNKYFEQIIKVENENNLYPESVVDMDEIDKHVEQLIGSFQDRIDAIEKRFPKTTTVEKIASVNDAILATKIEDLIVRIEKIEEKQLSKWDVATIVFAVLAALGTIVALIAAIIKMV